MTLIVNETRYKIDFTFALTVTLMLLLCKEETVIISLFSSMLHETGHLIFMFIFRQKVVSVTFGAFGVRIDRHSSVALSYKKEAIIAFGGIMINFLIAILSHLYYYLIDSDFALKLTAVNIIIALFNMIPLEVLDMGRVIKYGLLLQKKDIDSDRMLSIISAISVNILAIGTFVYTMVMGVNPSLIAVTIYLYVITLFKKWS